MTDPFHDPEVLTMKDGIKSIDMKIKDLQKEKAGISKLMRSRLARLITQKLMEEKQTEKS